MNELYRLYVMALRGSSGRRYEARMGGVGRAFSFRTPRDTTRHEICARDKGRAMRTITCRQSELPALQEFLHGLGGGFGEGADAVGAGPIQPA